MVIAFNKPYGVLSQFNENPDREGQRTLAEFDLPPDFHPVGRLDMDSEGLLLLTDDKELENDLLHPYKSHLRTYLVQVDGKPNRKALTDLEVGVEIRGYTTKKCKVMTINEPRVVPERVPPVDPASDARSTWLKMDLKEGKNRQVRRMTAKVGFPTLRLFRVSIGCYDLTDVEVGKWVVLSEEEQEDLFKRSKQREYLA